MQNWLDLVGAVLPLNPMVRGSGLTAYLLLFISVAGGLVLSLQWIPAKYRPAFFSYHRLFSQAALLMTLLHALTFFAAKYAAVSWLDMLVPFWAQRHTAEIGVGIIATYIMALLVVTSGQTVMKALRFENWRLVHILSYAAYWLALYHSVALAKSGNALFLNGLYPATVGLVSALTLLRLWKLVGRLQTSHENSAG